MLKGALKTLGIIMLSPLALACSDFRVIIMALPVVEFSREGYKIRKVFGKKSTVVK